MVAEMAARETWAGLRDPKRVQPPRSRRRSPTRSRRRPRAPASRADEGASCRS